MRKKKIAVIGAKGFPSFGGSARANEEIFTRLKDKYEVTVYALEGFAEEDFYDDIKQIILKSHRNNKISVFMYYIKAALHAIRFGDYDIIHLNHAASGYIVPILSKKYPVLLNIRGLFPHDKFNRIETKLMWQFRKIGIKRADYISTVEKYSVPYIKKITPQKGNVAFIPNGVNDLSQFYESEKEFDITFGAGRIIKSKGLHTLLDSLINLKFKGKIQILGNLDHDLDYKENILNKIEILSEHATIELPGLVKDQELLFKKIGQSKLFIFPSLVEGMSNMLLEVASIGVPVIASDIPQNTDVFNNDEMLFFEKENVSDLSNKINYSFDNEKIMMNKAQLAKKKVVQDHDWDKIARQYHGKYKSIQL